MRILDALVAGESMRQGTPLREERSGGERSEPERSSSRSGVQNLPQGRSVSPPDPEVPENPVRRRFTAQYKLRILEEADACKDTLGKIGELLRKEGLYSSHLTTWRLQRREGTLQGLLPKKRGRKAEKNTPKTFREKELGQENRRLRRRLERVELMLEIQKKLRSFWGYP